MLSNHFASTTVIASSRGRIKTSDLPSSIWRRLPSSFSRDVPWRAHDQLSSTGGRAWCRTGSLRLCLHLLTFRPLNLRRGLPIALNVVNRLHDCLFIRLFLAIVPLGFGAQVEGLGGGPLGRAGARAPGPWRSISQQTGRPVRPGCGVHRHCHANPPSCSAPFLAWQESLPGLAASARSSNRQTRERLWDQAQSTPRRCLIPPARQRHQAAAFPTAGLLGTSALSASAGLARARVGVAPTAGASTDTRAKLPRAAQRVWLDYTHLHFLAGESLANFDSGAGLSQRGRPACPSRKTTGHRAFLHRFPRGAALC